MSTAASRIYIVTARVNDIDKPTPARLVRAPNSARALAHIANEFHAAVASQDDLVAAIAAGVKVEESKSDAKGDAE